MHAVVRPVKLVHQRSVGDLMEWARSTISPSLHSYDATSSELCDWAWSCPSPSLHSHAVTSPRHCYIVDLSPVGDNGRQSHRMAAWMPNSWGDQ